MCSGSKWLHDGFRHRVSPVSTRELTAAADPPSDTRAGRAPKVITLLTEVITLSTWTCRLRSAIRPHCVRSRFNNGSN